jgi:hypothetical protein
MDNRAGRDASFILYFFLAAFVFVGSIFPITDNDVWWHLKTGQYIWNVRHIPLNDFFSCTIYGKPWTTYEWLSQVVLYMIASGSGLAGLTVFKALCVALIFLMMALRAKGSCGLVRWVVFAVAFLAMRDGLRERPQLFTYLLTAMFPLLLADGRTALLALVPLLEALWVNFHGPVAIIGLGITGVYCFAAVGAIKRNRVLLFTVTAATMLANPHGYKIFVYLYRFFHEGFNTIILEYRPPQVSWFYFPYFLLLAGAAVTMPAQFRKNRVSALLICLSGGASLLAVRNIPVFAVLAAPVVAQHIPPLFERISRRVITAACAGAILFVLFWQWGAALDVQKKYSFGIGDRHRARYATRFLQECHVRGNIFNDYDFGGYLIGALYPEHRVFVDGRLVEYGKEFVEKTFYYWKPEIWNDFEERYALTACIIPQERYYNACYIDSRKDWILVYWDDDALVYLKDIPANRPLIRTFGYRVLKPNAPDQSYLLGVDRNAAAREIRQSMYYSPQSLKARQIAAYLTRQHRR